MTTDETRDFTEPTIAEQYCNANIPPIVPSQAVQITTYHDGNSPQTNEIHTGDVIQKHSDTEREHVFLLLSIVYGGQWLILWEVETERYTTLELQDFCTSLSESDGYTVHSDPFNAF